ncbi:MAG: hypothetical protein PHF42_09590 [Pseudomonas sp.]|nr:hypothetical protein [Pseudomonas sp.]
MTVKVTGAEFKKFYIDKNFWPEGRFHEEVEITIDVNGEVITNHLEYDLYAVPDDAKITLQGGCVQDEDGKEFGAIDTYFRKWRKKQTTTFLVVEVPLDKIETIKATINAAGGKVVRNR